MYRYATFKNGIVYEYLEGVHYSFEEFLENSHKVAKRLCEFNSQQIEGFERDDGIIWMKFEELFKVLNENSFKGWKLDFEGIKKEVELIKNKLKDKEIFEISLAHNDLNRYLLLFNE